MKKSATIAKPAGDDRPTAVLVLGMHRSGTSVMTQVLHTLGCALSSDLLGANHSNPTGHWESIHAVEINDTLLAALGRRWDDIRQLPEDWLQRPETEDARLQIQAFLEREFSGKRLWALKDPRLRHLAPLWIPLIQATGAEVRVVMPLRHPAEVAYSLARRDGIAAGRSHLLWLQHLVEAEASSRGLPRVLCPFRDLLRDWRGEANRIADALGLAWPNTVEAVAAEVDGFLRPGLRHADAETGDGVQIAVPPLVGRLYDALLEDPGERAWPSIAAAAEQIAETVSVYSPEAQLRQLVQWRAETQAPLDRTASTNGPDALAALQQGLAAAGHAQTHAVEQLEQGLGALTKQVTSQRSEWPALLDVQSAALDALGRQHAEAAGQHGEALERSRDALGFMPVLDQQVKQIRRLSDALQERDRQAMQLYQLTAQLNTQLSLLRQTLAQHTTQAQAERAGLTEEIERLRDQMLGQADDLAQKSRQIDDFIGRLATAEPQLQQLLDSRSWALTRPMRAVRSLLAGGPWLTRKMETLSFLPPPLASVQIEPAQLTEMLPEDAQALSSAASSPRDMTALEPPMAQGTMEPGEAQAGSPARPVQPAPVEPGAELDDDEFGIPDPEEFDEGFYLKNYPDIAHSGLKPYHHFVLHGKAEGRYGNIPQSRLKDGGIAFDPQRETVLVVSHEASLTGAPVLALNIVKGLQKHYNVITMLLGPGDLVAQFQRESSKLLGPLQLTEPPLAFMLMEQLASRYPLRFAVVNSVESRVVLHSLAVSGVPTVSLIHEFAAYSRPRQGFRDALFWAAETVFSSPITYENAVAEYPDLATMSFNVIPQGRSVVSPDEWDEATQAKEEQRLLATLRPDGPDDDRIVVLAAGTVQQRKGVDLFIEVARKVLHSPGGDRFRFVWIGKGYNIEYDLQYSVYVADQLRRSNVGDGVSIIDETSNIEAAYRAADILMLSSRLDPLPNVALDAMAHGLPVLCFDRATGIAEFLLQAGLGEHCVSPFVDTADMADKVMALASPELRSRVGERSRRVVATEFDMDRYMARLMDVTAAATVRIQTEAACAREIEQSGLFRPDFFYHPPLPRGAGESSMHFAYVRPWATGLVKRKPLPGFHPGIYREQHGVSAPEVDSFADYLRSGRPPGPWSVEVIEPATPLQRLPPATTVALHLHVHYPELLGEILRRLALNAVRPVLFVSATSVGVADEIGEDLAGYAGHVAAVEVVPNRGRDIGPFLSAFDGALQGYDFIGHLHTKKSADVKDARVGSTWYQFLLDNLLGGEAPMADIILGRMVQDPSIGIVFPDDPHVVDWGKNRPYAEPLAAAMGLGELPSELQFPVGTMFWARTSALRRMFDLHLKWEDYPAEPVPYDGSMLHAVERLLPFAAAAQGGRTVVTNVPGVSR